MVKLHEIDNDFCTFLCMSFSLLLCYSAEIVSKLKLLFKASSTVGENVFGNRDAKHFLSPLPLPFFSSFDWFHLRLNYPFCDCRFSAGLYDLPYPDSSQAKLAFDYNNPKTLLSCPAMSGEPSWQSSILLQIFVISLTGLGTVWVLWNSLWLWCLIQ